GGLEGSVDLLDEISELGGDSAGPDEGERVGVVAADHVEVDVGDDVGTRDRWAIGKVLGPEQARLFGSLPDEQGGARGALAGWEVSEGFRHFDEGGGPGGVVVGAVVDGVAVDRGTDADVIVVGAETDELVSPEGVAASE